MTVGTLLRDQAFFFCFWDLAVRCFRSIRIQCFKFVRFRTDLNKSELIFEVLCFDLKYLEITYLVSDLRYLCGLPLDFIITS